MGESKCHSNLKAALLQLLKSPQTPELILGLLMLALLLLLPRLPLPQALKPLPPPQHLTQAKPQLTPLRPLQLSPRQMETIRLR